MNHDDIANLKLMEAAAGRTNCDFVQYNSELLRHAPALIAAAERCERLERAANNAYHFLRELRVPQDEFQAAMQIRSGGCVLEQLEKALEKGGA